MEKIALITGASGGIGKALAEVFAENGYSLLLIALDYAGLTKVQVDLKNKYQCNSKILAVDLSDPNSVDVVMNTFKTEINSLDVLINNVALGFVGMLSDLSFKELNDMLQVNVNVYTKLSYFVLPYMLTKQSGKILNVASIAAFIPGPYMSVYCASKAFILSFSEALYEEYKRYGITVSTLCPGLTKTEIPHASIGKTYSRATRIFPAHSAISVAKIAYQGLMNNKRVIIPGLSNKIIVFLMKYAPRIIFYSMLPSKNNEK